MRINSGAYRCVMRYERFTRDKYATTRVMEGLHDAVRTYARTMFQNLLVSFCTARYEEKQQITLELSIDFMEGIEI